MREAFPWDEAPKYLIRDRDAIFGGEFVAMTKSMGIEEAVTAPRSPWQNPYVEQPIGSNSPRVPGSRHRVEPEIVAADPAKLFSLLREVAHAFSTGERCPGAEGRRQTGERSYRCHSSGGRPAPSLRTTRLVPFFAIHAIHIFGALRVLGSLRVVLNFPAKANSHSGDGLRDNELSGRVSSSISASLGDTTRVDSYTHLGDHR